MFSETCLWNLHQTLSFQPESQMLNMMPMTMTHDVSCIDPGLNSTSIFTRHPSLITLTTSPDYV